MMAISSREDLEIWVEKYRPETLDKVVGQGEVVRRLKGYVKKGMIPHMLFAGPAGTGKTTCAIAVARELFGENWQGSFQELNASDERGIQTVRTKIKEFARTAPLGDAPFKIIFLDESDSLTADAQAALRRTMERYSSTCRFILSCNYSSRIIEPIQSRTSVFRFRPLTRDEVAKFSQMVAEKEGLELKEDGLEALVYLAQGDMRRAINTLQVAATVSEIIDADAIYKSSSSASPEIVVEMITKAIEGDFEGSRKVLDSLLLEYGLSGEDVIRSMHREIFKLNLDNGFKVDLIDRMGEAEFRLVEGGDERIQIEALLAYFTLAGGRISSSS
jgi:replication factor C small subunit